MEDTKTTPTNGTTPKPAPESRAKNSTNNRRPGVRFQAQRPPRLCPFCEQKVKTIDYKNVELLRHYLTDHGKIKPRRKVGTCAKHQRMLANAIKRARHVALLPFVTQSLRGESAS
jgi:small subunit ribosomal protein S18